MSDLIRRQDAIDVLEVLCQEHRYKIPGKAEAYSQYNEAWQDALDRAEGAIGNLPSAEPKTGEWIPCSERLPEESVPVLVCFTDWQTQEKTIDVSCLRDRNLWDDHGRYNKECVAWMPLPEPYSIESDGIKEETDE